MFTLMSSLVIAQSHYADVEIFVSEAGLVTIQGDTNIENLIVYQSPELTSKKGAYWLLNVTTDTSVASAYYKINLPKGSSITYMKIPTFSRIETTSSGLTIIGIAEEKVFDIIVQYEIKKEGSSSSPPGWFIALTGLVLVALFAAIRFRLKKIKNKRSKSKAYNPKTLTERQLQIVKILEKNNGSTTQAALEKETGLPKSSLSRNVDSLVRREIVTKEQSGMSNVVSLKKGQN